MNNKNKTTKVKKKLLLGLFVVLLLIILLYIAFYFINKSKSNQSSSALDNIKVDSSKITNTITERMLKLQELKNQNNDIIGWLEIEGTAINFPVLQSSDNSFYMTHDYLKNYNINGSIFLDKSYDWSVPYTNLLMYGHNNENGTMFHELLNYMDKNYYDRHPNIKFTTINDDSIYEIIAVFQSRVYYKKETNVFRYYYFLNAENETDFNTYITNSINASLYDTGKTANYGDQLLTLSTCSYHTTDGRFAIVARKVK